MVADRIRGESVILASGEQVFSELGGDVVILNLKDGIYYGLDRVGARIWVLIQEPRTVNELIDTLLAEYNVEADRCRQEVLALFEDLLARGLAWVKDETHTPISLPSTG